MPGSPYPQSEIRKIVDRAIQQQEVDYAIGWAKELKAIGLDQALALTLLLAREEDPRYPRAALRFLVRFIREVEPKLLNLKKVVDAFDCIERVRYYPEMTDEANQALVNLERQLRARRGE